MEGNSTIVQPITTAGISTTFSVDDTRTLYVITGSGALSGNITIAPTGTAQLGMNFKMLWLANFTLGAFTATIFGRSLTSVEATKSFQFEATYDGSAWQTFIGGLFGTAGVIETADIAAKAVTLPKMADITRGSIIVGGTSDAPTYLDTKTSGQLLTGDGTDLKSKSVTGDIAFAYSSGNLVSSISAGVIINTDINASAAIDFSKMAAGTPAQIIVAAATSGLATYTSVSGDIGITSGGVTSISSGVIVNADVNASAGIAFSKLAGLTGGHILVGSGSNVATDTAVSGVIAISNAGVTTFAGTAGKEAIHIPISFESGLQCKNSIKLPFACTIDFMFTSVTKAIAGTDAATITASIAGTPVTNGVVTIPLSSALDTQNTATPSAANSATVGQQIDFLSAKTTAGGSCILTVYVTRT